ncbi:glycosyltransferase family 4 protein [Metabacillus litoralis]|uniref:glycosyltransferase family 4 protein n=1 Tax=Metabacillus litoralis TaxID=152268 RepID=UPI002040F7F8|nr:glycosyltransferase family 4 protein [Metabacillus litoralis]
MKILYIATSFPEPSMGATIYTDLAEELYNSGHELVVAVTEQSRNKKRTELKRERGFEVLRIVIGNYFDVGYVQKGITTMKIPFLMRKGIKKYLNNKEFDLILFEAPPVTNAGLVAWAKRKFKCPAYLMLKDIFPQNAVDLGIIKSKGLIYNYFTLKEEKLLNTADYIGCMSQANIDYLLKQNSSLNSQKVELFPNTKKITSDINVDRYILREQFGIPTDACVFLFGGNMGRPQYTDLLCRAVKECKENSNIFFLFIGRGTDRYKLEDVIKENDIKNAKVIENLPREKYEQIIKECDVGLIVLDPRFTIPNYPSRILSYMEYAKPILAATDRVTDLKDLIEESQCGAWVWSGDADTFVATVKELAISDELKIMGQNGRRCIENNFNVNKSVEILERHFE